MLSMKADLWMSIYAIIIPQHRTLISLSILIKKHWALVYNHVIVLLVHTTQCGNEQTMFSQQTIHHTIVTYTSTHSQCGVDVAVSVLNFNTSHFPVLPFRIQSVRWVCSILHSNLKRQWYLINVKTQHRRSSFPDYLQLKIQAQTWELLPTPLLSFHF